MATPVRYNDTLKLKRSSGFPETLELGAIHPFTLQGRRVLHMPPTRVWLVEDVDGLWNYRGHAHILEQTINPIAETTTGRFQVTKIYPPEYARLVNQHESPEGYAYIF